MATLKDRIRAGHAFHMGLLTLELDGEEAVSRWRAEAWDLALVDLQHQPVAEPRLVEFCGTLAAHDMPVVCRVQYPGAALQIARVLDFGAAGVVVPMSEDPETVDEVVRSFYYPPLGARSCGLSYACGRREQQTPRAYADWWNENGILALQIETVRGVERVRDLVQPGVDLLLFGALDLSFSLGATPDCPFDSVADCQRHVVEQTRDLPVRVAVADSPFGSFGPSGV